MMTQQHTTQEVNNIFQVSKTILKKEFFEEFQLPFLVGDFFLKEKSPTITVGSFFNFVFS